MDAVAIVVGFALVAWMLVDSFETLLATGLQTNRFSFTRGYYRVVWGLYKRACRRLRDDRRRERWLARLGPV